MDKIEQTPREQIIDHLCQLMGRGFAEAMVADYAATLRQQAARVDEGDLTAMRESAMAIQHNKETWFPMTDRRLRRAAEALLARKAALAQNTQGEAIGYASPQILRLMRTDGFRAVAIYPEPGEGRVPLYLHAERARVPDGMVLVPREPTPEMLAAVEGSTCSVRVAEDDSVEYPLSEDECDEIYRNMLAAAPSQPKNEGEVRHG